MLCFSKKIVKTGIWLLGIYLNSTGASGNMTKNKKKWVFKKLDKEQESFFTVILLRN